MSAIDTLLARARPEIRALTPYSSARMEAGATALMLNANESPWPPLGDAENGLNRYPAPQPAALRARLAGLYGVAPEQVLAGRGSDEAIDLLVRAFCRPGRDALIVCPPTFGMYGVCAEIQGARVLEVPLTANFALDIDALLAAATTQVKLVFVCSPNNPTGGLVPLAVIERLAAALAGRALVIVDEAYIEFAEAPSAATALERHTNLGVLRTLSKAWALAGTRIGCLLAHPELIALLARIMPPYPLPTPSVKAAARALTATGEALMRERTACLAAERVRLARALQAMAGVTRVLPSQANFLTVRLIKPADVQAALAKQGIAVRNVAHYRGLDGCLRFSLGTPTENDRLLAAVAQTT